MTEFKAEEPMENDTGPDGSENIETLRQALDEEKLRAEEYLANWQRAQADFINYKRRAEREREELGLYANATLMKGLLPVLADLSRALEAVPPKLAGTPWVDGVRMISGKLVSSLEAAGLTRIEALGQPFNPLYHEAVRQDRGAEGMVIEEINAGYMLHDRLLSPAVVVVGNGEAETKEEN